MYYARVVRRRLLLLCSILLAACTCTAKGPEPDASEAEIEPAPVLPPIGSRVLLREARGLALEPRPDAPRVFGPPTKLRVAEVVAHVGELVELRSVADLPHDLCSAIGADPGFELRFFASLDELEPVLGKPKQIEFEDGTRLAFVAGVPVLGEGPHARLRVDGVSFGVPLATDEVARWFEHTPREGPARKLSWAGHGALHYGAHELDERHGIWTYPSYDTRAIEGGMLMSFANACGDFTLRSDTTDFDAGRDLIPQRAGSFDPDMTLREAGILGLRPPECEPSVRWTAPVGTKLWWRETGTAAGVVVRETDLPSKPDELDDKICFIAAELGLCIDKSQLRREEEDCGWTGTELEQAYAEGFGRPREAVPQVNVGKTKVSAGLDPDIVRRIVRAHINEIRRCYNTGLRQEPKLRGDVVVVLEIAATGKVGSSQVSRDALAPADTDVAACIAKAIGRWTFPKPIGGQSVTVVQQFELRPH